MRCYDAMAPMRCYDARRRASLPWASASRRTDGPSSSGASHRCEAAVSHAWMHPCRYRYVKGRGVARLSERQALATAVGKARRGIE